MARETIITIEGNLTADPELRFTASGIPVAAFTVASTPRFLDKDSGQWKDKETLFLRCSAWRRLAENVAESLTKGSGVMVTGRLKQRSYTTTEGENRTVIELDADNVGASLMFATATVKKATRDHVPHPADRDGQDPALAAVPSGADPWASDPQDSGAAGFSGTPPF